jgi:group I intron endonuclease
MNNYCVYKITFPNNKLYIGLTNNFIHRMVQHKSNKKQGKLSNAIKKYGFDNCKKEIIACCLTKQEACEMEMYLIKKHNTIDTGYNITIGGELSPMLTQSVYDKLLITVKTQESINKRKKAALIAWKNDSRRKNISEKNKKRFQDPEYKKTIIAAITSKKSIENRNKTKRTKEWSEKQSNKLKEFYKKGNFTHNSVFLLCIETNKVFSSYQQLCLELNTCNQTIRRYFENKNKTIKGYTFKKITKEEYLKIKGNL